MSAKTKASLNDFDPNSNLIDFNNLDKEINVTGYSQVDLDFLMSAEQLRVRPPSGKSALQQMRPQSKGPEIPQGVNMKTYILDRQKKLN